MSELDDKAVLAALRIGVIGAGNMAYAMVKAFVTKGSIDPKSITISAPSNRNLPKFVDEFGCNTTHNNQDLVPGGKFDCNVILICVKPIVLKKFLSDGKPIISWQCERAVVISILAGVRLVDIRKAVDCKEAVVYRIMTNTACAIGEANCAIVRSDDCSSQDDQIVRTLTSCFGKVEFIAEYLMDAFSGIAGCGVAFGYTFIQAMADGAVKMGIPRQQAIEFAAQTLCGSAKMVIETGKHPIVLRDEVCSAGGSTIVGVHALQRHAVPSAIMEAVELATIRNSELSK